MTLFDLKMYCTTTINDACRKLCTKHKHTLPTNKYIVDYTVFL